jgi:predicted XRE-type DNA-binding protein
MIALIDHITRNGLTRSKAAKLFGVTQPCISDLMRGHIDFFAIDLFAIDSLINMLSTAGLRVETRVRKAA